MNQKTRISNKKGIGSLSAKIAKITALLVAAVALINGAVDLTNSVLKIPTNIYEKTNHKLFEEHFGEEPLTSLPVDVIFSGAKVEMLVQVFSDGDVFIRYGTFQQWIPFKPFNKTASLSLIPEAFAQAIMFRQLKEQIGPLWPFIIDIDKEKEKQLEQRKQLQETKPDKIEKSYFLSELKDDHPSLLKSSSRKYTKTFSAMPEYKITKFKFQLGSENHSRIEKIELADDAKSVRIFFVLTSGPAFNRWRGWIQGSLNTLQERNP